MKNSIFTYLLVNSGVFISFWLSSSFINLDFGYLFEAGNEELRGAMVQIAGILNFAVFLFQQVTKENSK